MISSLAEAEARVVITTSRVRFSAFGLVSKQQLPVELAMPIVVRVLGEHLAGGALAADQAGEVLGDADQPAAVVAQVEHQLGGAGVAQAR